MKHTLFSADAHVVEPPNWWGDSMPKKFEPLLPRIVDDGEGGDAWKYADLDPAPIGIYVAAGSQHGNWKWLGRRFDEIEPGMYDGAGRLRVMDVDGVTGEVLFPSGRNLTYFTSHADPDFHLAGVRAYNDWVHRFMSPDPNRLIGLCATALTSVKDAVTELERCIKLGFKGVLITSFPSGGGSPSPADDPFWAVCEEAGIPVHLHVRVAEVKTNKPSPRGKQGGSLSGLSTTGMLDMPRHVSEIIFAGIHDRFPRLQFVSVEAGAGWAPYLLEKMEDRWWRNKQWAEVPLEQTPSAYFRRNWHIVFMVDNYAIRNRHAIGVERMMWSSDYPHHGCEWPESLKYVNQAFANVPDVEREAILAGNAVKLYKLKAEWDTPTAGGNGRAAVGAAPALAR
jgi:predicted TIM-barrel fold metal-dependent hydrolase